MTTQTFRPIKFRVWNKAKNKWEHGPGHEPNLFGETILLGGFMNVPFEELNDCVALQFTGLTDSNGKEVYEGDIVCEKITNDIAYEGYESNIGQVFFAAGSFMINGDGTLYDHVYSLSPDRLEDYLVIGNVFENPELLQSCSKN